MPRLSIITINLNNASGLSKTMNSVFSQTSRDFEYIIIDGGSTDGSVDVIRSFTPIEPGTYTPLTFENVRYVNMREGGNDLPAGEPRNYLCDSWGNIKSAIRNPQSAITPESRALSSEPCAPCPVPITFWLTEPDSGIYQAMNKGIRVARGEYCQFLNSGDWLAAPDVTEKMLENTHDCSIIYGNMIKQFPNKKILINKQIDLESFLTFYQGSLNHSPAYIKRNLFEKYGCFDEELKIVSDWKFFLQVVGLFNEKVVYRDINVTYFNMIGVSNTNNELDRFERQKVLQELVPSKILTDYIKYSKYIFQIKRICRFKLTKWIVYIIERFLFLIEKFETKLKKEHIFY